MVILTLILDPGSSICLHITTITHNDFDWIIPSSSGLFHDQVNYCAIFPLPPHNPNRCLASPHLLLPPVIHANYDPEIKVFWPWDDGRYILLALLLEQAGFDMNWIHIAAEGNIFDHSPMYAYFQLKRNC